MFEGEENVVVEEVEETCEDCTIDAGEASEDEVSEEDAE